MVQILTYRTQGIEAELNGLFASLAKVQAPEGGWAIVIIDNPSPLGNLAEYLQANVMPLVGKGLPDVTIHHNEKNTGFAGGHNDGYVVSQKYHPEFIFLLNQDAHVAPDVLVEAVKMARKNANAAIVQSRIMLAQDERQFNSCGNAMHFLGLGYSLGYKDVYEPGSTVEEQRHGLPMFYASGAAVLLRVSALEKIGGMFESSYFMYHEDLDVSWRARLAGFDVEYAEASVMYHHYEFSRSVQKFYWMERNRHLTNLTNYEVGTLVLMAPAMLVMELATFVFAVKSGWWREKLRSWAFFFKKSTWDYILERRRLIRSLRVKGDGEILRYTVGIVTAQEVRNPLVTYVMNPVFGLYRKILLLLAK